MTRDHLIPDRRLYPYQVKSKLKEPTARLMLICSRTGPIVSITGRKEVVAAADRSDRISDGSVPSSTRHGNDPVSRARIGNGSCLVGYDQTVLGSRTQDYGGELGDARGVVENKQAAVLATKRGFNINARPSRLNVLFAMNSQLLYFVSFNNPS